MTVAFRAAVQFALIALLFPAYAADNPPAPSPTPVPQGDRTLSYHGTAYLVHEFDPRKDDLRLYLKDDDGHFLHDFAGLEKFIAAKGGRLIFAANAGMFQPDSTPCGLLVQNGVETSPLNLADGEGNFYMKPNGVFVLNAKHEAHIVDSTDYAALLVPPVWATQSGPLLVHGGDINPDFNPESKNRNIRSGVGVRADGNVVLALSKTQVTFYDFAALFRTKMKCPNALYLDGTISAFYAPGRPDAVPHSFGPIIGEVEKK